jgi:hypothetical protein
MTHPHRRSQRSRLELRQRWNSIVVVTNKEPQNDKTNLTLASIIDRPVDPAFGATGTDIILAMH